MFELNILDMESASTASLLDLPNETLVHIAKHLTDCSLFHLSHTCQRLASVVNAAVEKVERNVLQKEDLDLPVEALRRYWDHDSGYSTI